MKSHVPVKNSAIKPINVSDCSASDNVVMHTTCLLGITDCNKWNNLGEFEIKKQTL